MQRSGTTWLKSSRRKVVAAVAGLAMMAGAAGAVIPEPDVVEDASTWSLVAVEKDTGKKRGPSHSRSTWS